MGTRSDLSFAFRSQRQLGQKPRQQVKQNFDPKEEKSLSKEGLRLLPRHELQQLGDKELS
jgi:hypothetical protein